jgi:hypothetical protein
MAIVIETIRGYVTDDSPGPRRHKFARITDTFGNRGPRSWIVQLQGCIGDHTSDVWFFEIDATYTDGDLPTYKRSGNRYMQEGFMAAILQIPYMPR